MDWVYLLNGFHGRISRKTFWIAMSVVALANIVGYYVAEQIDGDRLAAIVDLAFTYPEFAIAAKRGNDRDMPLWVPCRDLSAPAWCSICSTCCSGVVPPKSQAWRRF